MTFINFSTKDSGERKEFASGMHRDVSKDKPRFDLLTPLWMDYKSTMLYRWAMLMARGAEKYTERNWESANSREEYYRFKESAYRHFMQWYHDENDEDHASAVMFNIQGAEYVNYRMLKEMDDE